MPAGTHAHDRPAALPGIDAHAHARALLMPVLEGAARPSHAYLFHGPAGTGKRSIARAFAAALLAQGASDPDAVVARVARGEHPDLTWVTASGATEMLVADIERPVVAAAAHTPFEATRRVFVIEAAHTLNEQAANRMLKTLEEPAAFVHLLLLTDRPAEVMPTIASRCLHVRFDPLPAAVIAERLEGEDTQRLLACSRLALGDAARAARLASENGAALRASAEAFVRWRAPRLSARGSGCWRSPGRRGRARGRTRRRGCRRSSSCSRPRSAGATSAKAWSRGVAWTGARARRPSISRWACASCGCGTCCVCARGLRS